MLRQQGWQPGEFLGAKDAPHAEFHTAANANFVKVSIKDDAKGLGFDKAKDDQVTGLDVFSDLLSRLNGKTDTQIEDDQKARMVIKTNRFVEQKYGPMRFVKGGLLVGDTMEDLMKKDDTSSKEATNEESEESDEPEEPVKQKESKKRKAEDKSEGEEVEEDRDARKEAKRQRKEERRLRREKKEKKAKAVTEDEAEASESLSEDAAKALRKKEKKAKKAKRQLEIEVETTEIEYSAMALDEEPKKSKKKDKKDKKSKKKKEEDSTEADASASTSEASTPAAVDSGTSTPNGSRNFVRSRFIAQKKRAVMDAKALSQVSYNKNFKSYDMDMELTVTPRFS